MKKQYSISVEKDLMDKLDNHRKVFGISRNAMISFIIADFEKYMIGSRIRANMIGKKAHNVFTCQCSKCEKIREDGERAGDEERESN